MAKATSSGPCLVRESQDGPRIVRTEGYRVWDADGREYVDFVMGWCVGNFGWGNAVLAKAAAEFDGPDYIYPGHDWPEWETLARELVALAPGRLTRCFRATGGSEAVDLALQAAQLHTGRSVFVSLEDSYHGNTLATLSVGASENREDLPNLLRNCRKLKPPLDARALQRLGRLLERDDVAAVVMEPISINLGVLVPDREFMRGMARLCRQHGTLLILDEVACGFGRTGALFACEHFGVQPDLMAIAKAVTGGLGGMGALLATAPVAKSMEKNGNFYSTYGWHPRSVAVALAALRYIGANRDGLLGQVAVTSEYFRERLSEMPIGTPAIAGLAIGLNLGRERAAAVQRECRRNGLLVTSEGGTLLLTPALNIDKETAARGLDILQRSL
jgi:acetylornithine/succinyldiaminopimelate/putrescine aminotransferase